MTTKMQEDVVLWGDECFGKAINLNPQERILRVLEESFEVAQVLGISEGAVIAQLLHTYSRPVGEINDELGGVTICLYLLAEALNINCEANFYQTLQKCWERINKIREKQKTKPVRADTHMNYQIPKMEVTR